MFQRNSLITRIAIGKLLGFAVGLVGFMLLPQLSETSGLLLRWGVLLWYTTLGGLIGLMGVITWHPILKLPLPWWARSAVLGAWMNFVLAFFTYTTLRAGLRPAVFGESFGLFATGLALEGALIGLVIGYAATRIGGEGPGIVDTTLNAGTT